MGQAGGVPASGETHDFLIAPRRLASHKGPLVPLSIDAHNRSFSPRAEIMCLNERVLRNVSSSTVSGPASASALVGLDFRISITGMDNSSAGDF